MFSPAPRPNHSRSAATFVLAFSLAFCLFVGLFPHQAIRAQQSTPPPAESAPAATQQEFDSQEGGPSASRQETPPPAAQQGQETRSPLAGSPALKEFKEWVEQYKIAGSVSASEQRGMELARQRRPVMARLIEDDPRSAVGLAVPARVRERMPEPLRREVEEEKSGYGDYLVMVYDEIDPQTGEFVRARTERKVVLDGKTYRASVYGRKLGMTTKLNIPLRGVVMGDVIALAESPVRVLGDDERGAAPTGQGIDAEVGGRVLHFENREQLDRFEEELKRRELTIGPGGAGKFGDDGGLSPSDANAEMEAAAAENWTVGPKTVLLMRVDFSDAPGEPVDHNGKTLTLANADALINTQADDFYKTNSYNKTSITGTVTRVLRMPRTANWYGSNNDPFQLMADARGVARAAGYNTDNFNLDIIAFKRIEAFTWAGLGYIGAKGSWLNGYFTLRETSHELGHNYGLNHANLWKTTDGTVIGKGASTEYANPFDAMGGGQTTPAHHFSAWFKSLLAWLPSTGVQNVTSGGTYRLQAYDYVTATGRRALKIQKDASTYYWVEFRQTITEYPATAGGAVIYWGYTENQQSNLLDMTPKTSDGANDAPLAVGQTFTDARNGIQITAKAKTTSSPAALDVTVTFTTVLDKLALNASSIAGGSPITGTVTLNAPAPLAGATVKLSDNLSATTMPASVDIPSGARTQTFTITTTAVTTAQTGTFTASYRGVNKTSPLTVEPLMVSALTLNKSSVGGGSTVTGTVTLNGAAPAGGAEVALGDDILAANTPPSVIVPAGAKTKTFSITTARVTANESGTVTATLGGATKSAPLTIMPTVLASLTLRPASVAGGVNVTGTLALNGPAPAGGMVINLSDNIPATTLPPSVTIPGGLSSKTFTITSQVVDATQSGQVTATHGSVTKLAALTIRPPALNALTLAPASVAGGNNVTGTVSLDGPAPASGATVTLSDNLTTATTPASVNIQPGAKSATFIIKTVVVNSKQTGTVTASRAGVTKSAALTVRPVSVQSITVDPNPIVGGNSATGTIVIERISTSNVVVNLSDNLPATTIPASVVVPAGKLSTTFQIATTHALPSQHGVLTATANTESKSLNLSVLNTRSQLIINPGFESGVLAWVIYPGGENKVIVHSTDGEAHSGEQMALLGGTPPSSTEYFYQEVTLPANAISADLALYLRIYTQESGGVLPSDTLEVQIRDGNDQVLGTLATFSNLDQIVWFEQKVYDLLPYKGQTIRVYFLGKSSASSPTFFYIDDVTLDVLQ